MMNLVVKGLTMTTTMMTVTNWYLNLKKRNLNEAETRRSKGHTMELTRLLEECRVMNEGRDETIARILPTLTINESDEF